ncbi:hypothetical protein [Cytobacillus pseudoceanisediminis]|uniref:hypothetical protein n=1 Tax=Cytobacillus pseudoceanisediminis TaxID=3051614 RepID=UPI003C2EC561
MKIKKNIAALFTVLTMLCFAVDGYFYSESIAFSNSFAAAATSPFYFNKANSPFIITTISGLDFLVSSDMRLANPFNEDASLFSNP